MKVHLIKTGVANMASVAAALERIGVEVAMTSDPGVVCTARAVVLPGVGSFGTGMKALRRQALDAPLVARIRAGRPTLAICLGLQLLCESSEETPGVQGLGVLPAAVRRLPRAPQLPHFGWNRIQSSRERGLSNRTVIENGNAYFAHTFCIEESRALDAAGWSTAITQEGTPFVSAVERAAVLACQFHPELSGAYGASLLRRWVDRAARVSLSTCSSANA